jgi:hypothetical protein
VAAKRKLDLSRLYQDPPEDLRLASLHEGRVEGLAFRYTIILPLYSEQTGEEVFSLDNHVTDLIRLRKSPPPAPSVAILLPP